MAALTFQIEFVMPERGYVLARALEASIAFRLIDGSKLGGYPVEPRYLDIPRAKNSDGTQRTDLFAFLLKEREHAARLRAGDLVELTDWRD